MSCFDENVKFVKNGCVMYGDICICITRGWLCPNDVYFEPHDEKIYIREANRLEAILKEAVSKNPAEIMVMLHYPPTNDKKEPSHFTRLIEEYNVKTVLYGHLHGKNCFDFSLKGDVGGVKYILTSADYLNFIPQKIL
jgi:predicted phosphohydrolase